MKVFLEEQLCYDKSRKITQLDDQSFGIPILVDVFDNCVQKVPEALSSIVTKENLLSTSLESSYSLKERVHQCMSEWCKQRMKMDKFVLFRGDR